MSVLAESGGLPERDHGVVEQRTESRVNSGYSSSKADHSSEVKSELTNPSYRDITTIPVQFSTYTGGTSLGSRTTLDVESWEYSLGERNPEVEAWAPFPSTIAHVLECSWRRRQTHAHFQQDLNKYIADLHRMVHWQKVSKRARKRRSATERETPIRRFTLRDSANEPDRCMRRSFSTESPGEATAASFEVNNAIGLYCRLSPFPTLRMVTHVDLYKSPTTTLAFDQARQLLAKKYRPTNAVWVYHPTTDEADVEAIMIDGFKVGCDGVVIPDRGEKKRGVYGATGPFAANYDTTKKVILSRALPGLVGVRPDQNCDSWTSGNNWVAFRSAKQLLPVYVLHFQPLIDLPPIVDPPDADPPQDEPAALPTPTMALHQESNDPTELASGVDNRNTGHGINCPHCSKVSFRNEKYDEGEATTCPYCYHAFQSVTCPHCGLSMTWKNNNYVPGDMYYCPFPECQRKFTQVNCPSCRGSNVWTGPTFYVRGQLHYCAFDNCDGTFT